MYFCYILECADGSYSVGVTDNPQRRHKEHNQGKAAKYTAARRPVHMIWTEQHPALSLARKRENQLKRWSHTLHSPSLRCGGASANVQSLCL